MKRIERINAEITVEIESQIAAIYDASTIWLFLHKSKDTES